MLAFGVKELEVFERFVYRRKPKGKIKGVEKRNRK